MRNFQKENCIKNQCVTNVQYLYDCIKNNESINISIKIKPVIVVSICENRCIAGHLVLSIYEDNEEIIIDPSYDVFSIKNKYYYDNIKSFTENCCDKSNSESKVFAQNIISTFMKFVKLADQMNNGKFLICDKEFYNNQADYIEKIII